MIAQIAVASKVEVIHISTSKYLCITAYFYAKCRILPNFLFILNKLSTFPQANFDVFQKVKRF